jgi:uncharacterized membrane protein
MNRMFLKTCTYAVMHLTVAVIVAFALTRSWQIALAVGIVEPIVQTFAFALHERFWSRAGKPDGPAAAGCVHGRMWKPRRGDPGQGAARSV